MDEPLSNFDDDLKAELCRHLLELHAQLGFTLVYVTHSKEEMRRIGTRAILLRGGKEVPHEGDQSRSDEKAAT